jgi:hypothetical protein
LPLGNLADTAPLDLENEDFSDFHARLEEPIRLEKASDSPLREELHDHLRRIEAALFRYLEASLGTGDAPNATLARELRQYIHDLLASEGDPEETEWEELDLSLEQIRRAHALLQERRRDSGTAGADAEIDEG